MALALGGTINADIDLFGYITNTTTSTEDDRGYNWSDWSPILDWDALSGDHNDFSDLIDSMMENNIDVNHHIVMDSDPEETETAEDSKGLRLVHLLMAAAEAMTGANSCRELARVILFRLNQLASPTGGTNIERLAVYFTHALQNLLEGAIGVVHHGKHILNNGPHNHYPTDVLAAFQILQDISPYVMFGHLTANQAILESVVQYKRIHIVDYDVMEGIQWASFMQALVSRKDGPPSLHLRITALSRGGNHRRSIGTVQETGRRLVSFAASVGLRFSFHQCKLESEERFRPSALKLVKGEALVINCMLHLSHLNYQSPTSIASFLNGSITLNPRLVTLVEEEVGSFTKVGFMGQFMESLHHYSAIYDSLEAGSPMQSKARTLVERVYWGPRIAGSLIRMYGAVEKADDDDEDGWSCEKRLAANGFRGVNVTFANHCQAKLLLGLFNDGYEVEELENNKLVLGWKSRRILSASTWTSPRSDL